MTIQLDPTFQPHFELYTGLVFQLICDGRSSPVVIARGGRYDDLVRRCGATDDQAYGAGFSLAIDPIRELISDMDAAQQQQSDVLVAFSQTSSLESAMERQRNWHQQGRTAVMALEPLASRQSAEQLARGPRVVCSWIGSILRIRQFSRSSMAHSIVTDVCEGIADCVDACPVACIDQGKGKNKKGHRLLLDQFRHLH